MKHFLSGFATCAVICSLMFVGSSALPAIQAEITSLQKKGYL